MNRFSLTEFYKNSSLVRILNVAILVLMIALILLLPLPFGAVEPGSIYLMEMVVTLCFALWVTKLLFGGKAEELSHFQSFWKSEKEAEKIRIPFFHRFPYVGHTLRALTFGKWPRKYHAENLVENQATNHVSERRFFSILGYPVRNTQLEIIGLILLSLLILQILPLPHLLSRLISPHTAKIYEDAANAAGKQIGFHPFSLDPLATFSKLLEYTSYFLIYIVIVNSVPAGRYYRLILIAILVSAAFQAAYGLVEYVTGHQHIFFYKKKVNAEVATGTFINRNHYATYLEMSLPLLFGLITGFLHQPKKTRRPWNEKISQILRTEGNKPLFFPFLIFLLLVGIYCSLSRSGIVFSIIVILTFFTVYGLLKREISRNLLVLCCSLLVLMISAGVFWEPLYLRFAKISTEFTAERARIYLYRDTARIFFDFPVIGTGLGTFMQVFPMYRSFIVQDVYRYAHNDYLQFLSECGFFSLLILGAFFYRIWERLRQLVQRPISKILMIQLGAFCSLVSLGLHSLTDFVIQIPAIAMNGVIILSLFWRTPAGEDKPI